MSTVKPFEIIGGVEKFGARAQYERDLYRLEVRFKNGQTEHLLIMAKTEKIAKALLSGLAEQLNGMSKADGQLHMKENDTFHVYTEDVDESEDVSPLDNVVKVTFYKWNGSKTDLDAAFTKPLELYDLPYWDEMPLESTNPNVRISLEPVDEEYVDIDMSNEEDPGTLASILSEEAVAEHARRAEIQRGKKEAEDDQPQMSSVDDLASGYVNVSSQMSGADQASDRDAASSQALGSGSDEQWERFVFPNFSEADFSETPTREGGSSQAHALESLISNS